MLNSPVSRIRLAKHGAPSQNAQPTQLPIQQSVEQHIEHTRRLQEEDWARHEEQVQLTLRANRGRVRNGILLVLAGVAGLTGAMAYKAKPANSAYEENQQETEPGKKEGKRPPSSTPGQSAKPQKIEIHRDIPREFFVMAEKMINKGSLRSRHLDKAKRASWSKSIVEQMSRADIPLNAQNLMIVFVTIDHETGFHESGIISSPESILDRKIAEFKKENPKVYDMMEDRVKGLRAQALRFINSRRAYNLAHTGKNHFTERDVNLAIDYAMKLYESEVPEVVQKIIPKESLNKYRPGTSGCMEMDVKKAIKLAKEVDGEVVSDRKMRELLDTRKGGLYYAMLYLKKIIDSHTTHYGERMSAEEVRYVFADYNMGEYTTRNAAIQSNLRALGKDIAVDGDLMSYDEEGKASRGSDTEKAIRDVLKAAGEDMHDLELHLHLSMEKTMDFEYTRTYQLLKKIFKKHGLTKTNVIPSMRTSGSFIKFGTTKMSAAGYAEGSYKRYEALRKAMPEKPHKAPKAKYAKLRK